MAGGGPGACRGTVRRRDDSRRRPVAALTVAALACALLPLAASPARAEARTERIANSTDVVRAAVGVSQATFRDGGAAHVLIGRDDVFADSLAGSSLAGTSGPILYTTGGEGRPLRAETLAEIRRVLGAPVGCNTRVQVFLLGGTKAVSQQVEDALGPGGLRYCVRRFDGASRVETARDIAEYVARLLGPPKEVLLARADDWPDAATGGAYAAASRTPVLLTQRGSLHPATRRWLERQRPERVTLLGGGAALSPDVDRAVSRIAATRRVAGAARDITAVEIARRLWGEGARGGGITLVRGNVDDGWAYALSAAVFAAVRNAPVLYTASDLSAGTREFLAAHDFTEAIAAGPSSLVSGSALARAAALGSPLRPAARISPSAVFADVRLPRGVTVQPNNGNVVVTHDFVPNVTADSRITRFDRNGEVVASRVLSTFQVGLYGALARDPGNGTLWHLLPDGRLQRLDPATLLPVQPEIALKAIGIDSRAFYDVATGVVTSLGGSIQPAFADYNDLTVLVAGNQRVVLVSGVAKTGGFPFVVRLRLNGNTIVERRVIVASSARTGLGITPGDAMSRGIAVSPQGVVLTTLPLVSNLFTTFDTFFAFGADFVPGVGLPPRRVLPGTLVSSRGMASDANGNFYVVTSAAGITAPGFIPGTGQTNGGALVILPAALNRIVAVGEVPLAPTTHARAVDVDRNVNPRRAYVATDRHVLIFDF